MCGNAFHVMMKRQCVSTKWQPHEKLLCILCFFPVSHTFLFPNVVTSFICNSAIQYIFFTAEISRLTVSICWWVHIIYTTYCKVPLLSKSLSKIGTLYNKIVFVNSKCINWHELTRSNKVLQHLFILVYVNVNGFILVSL